MTCIKTNNEKLATEQVPTEVKIAQRIAYEHAKMRDSNNEMGEYCRMVDREGKQVLLCTWSRRSPTLDFDFAFLEDPENKETKQYQNAEHLVEEWPSKEECDHVCAEAPRSTGTSLSTNLANILYRWGRIDDALVVMKDALNISDIGVTTQGLSGHYRRALEVHPELQDAFNTLRALRCYLKYHQGCPERCSCRVGHHTSHTELWLRSQQQTMGPQHPDRTESRVICKTGKMENGEEKCIIETRMRNKAGKYLSLPAYA
nr:hypothetical protein BaRGS_012744 [Batillaria attramentaria]